MDREKVIRIIDELIFEAQKEPTWKTENALRCLKKELLKEQENLLGIQQTADSITFVSTGTAQQGEERGIMLGKSLMHEWLKKELLYRRLLTDEIRSVFDEAKRI